MTYIQAIVLAVQQGISELFPVSSLGHAVILPKLLHWPIDEQGNTWLSFLVALHLGTAVALFIYFRQEWLTVINAFVNSVRRGEMRPEDHDERLAWMVVLGTVPAGIVGFVLEHPLRSLFASPYVAASFLIVNGAILFVGERIRRRQATAGVQVGTDPATASFAAGPSVSPFAQGLEGVQSSGFDAGRYRDITKLTWRDAAVVGFAQIGALVPGISRSGVTMVAGLVAGLTHEAAARYAFLLATPLIGAAGVLELPQLFGSSGKGILGQAFIGAILAGIAAYISVRFLMRYFEFGRLDPFAYYCWGAGALSVILLSANV